jgi:toxin ParE1/3/4
MSVRWARKALSDLDSIFDAITLDRASVAERVIRELLAHGEQLAPHPRRGRSGRVPGTRELVVPRLPYIVVYSLTPSHSDIKPDVTILRVIHGAMQWPPEEPL